MKMHHLSKEKVEQIMEKVKILVETESDDQEKYQEIFALSEMDGEKYLECKSNDMQKDKVSFEMDAEKGVRFFDPFNFYTSGVYKDVDGWTVWTVDNLKEPWSY